MKHIIQAILNILSNHSDATHTTLGFLLGGVSVPSIIKWNSNRKSLKVKRTEARIKETHLQSIMFIIHTTS